MTPDPGPPPPTAPAPQFAPPQPPAAAPQYAPPPPAQPPAAQPQYAPPPPAPPQFAAPPAAPVAGQLSPDGRALWNGVQWVSAVTADGRYRWDGINWVPAGGRSAPAAAVAAGGLGFQFGGAAAWSIGFGLVSIVVPFFANFYFPILPLFGLYRAVIAIRSGRLVGGVVGILLNLAGAAVTLFASGLIG